MDFSVHVAVANYVSSIINFYSAAFHHLSSTSKIVFFNFIGSDRVMNLSRSEIELSLFFCFSFWLYFHIIHLSLPLAETICTNNNCATTWNREKIKKSKVRTRIAEAPCGARIIIFDQIFASRGAQSVVCDAVWRSPVNRKKTTRVDAILGKYSLWATIVGSGTLMPIGDLVSQEIEHRKGTSTLTNWFDWTRNANMFLVGAAWNVFFCRTSKITSKKIHCDQMLLASPYTATISYLSGGWMERISDKEVTKSDRNSNVFISPIGWFGRRQNSSFSTIDEFAAHEQCLLLACHTRRLEPYHPSKFLWEKWSGKNSSAENLGNLSWRRWNALGW